MIIYFVLLLVVMTSIYFAHRLEKFRLIFWILYFFIFASIVLVAGMRSRYVGTDTGNYVRWFENTQKLSDIWDVPLEPGFFVLAWLAHFMSDNYMPMLSLVAILSAFCFMYIIRRFSANEEMSFFVLLAASYLFVSYNGARHGLANAVFFLAIGSVYNRNLIYYALIVAVAFLFHKSVIITLPAYFLITRRSTTKLYFIIFLTGIAGIWFIDFFMQIGMFIDVRYEQYAETAQEGLGLLSLGFTIVLCVFFLMFKRFVIVDWQRYEVLLNMFLLATVITFVTAILEMNASGMRRLSSYFALSEILLWPIVYQNLSKKKKPIFLFYFVPLYLVYYGLSLDRYSNLVPYTFNPVIVDWFNKILL